MPQNRGDLVPGRGDITGQRFVSNTEEKQRRAEALTRTRNTLVDGPTVVVDGADGRAYIVPRTVVDAFVARFEDQAARERAGQL
jgi:hypothetical protein